jgi:hypothetical protein
MQLTPELIVWPPEKVKKHKKCSYRDTQVHVDKKRKPVKAFVTASLSAVGGRSL